MKRSFHSGQQKSRQFNQERMLDEYMFGTCAMAQRERRYYIVLIHFMDRQRVFGKGDD